MTTSNRMSIAEGAEHLGVSLYTLRAWLRQKRLPFYRLGRRVVLDRADVDAFLQANREEAQERASDRRSVRSAEKAS